MENDIMIVSDKNSRPVQGQPPLSAFSGSVPFRCIRNHKTTLNLT
jgi:hypothetical protein